jgi:hypothetical protein
MCFVRSWGRSKDHMSTAAQACAAPSGGTVGRESKPLSNRGAYAGS